MLYASYNRSYRSIFSRKHHRDTLRRPLWPHFGLQRGHFGVLGLQESRRKSVHFCRAPSYDVTWDPFVLTFGNFGVLRGPF